MSKSKRFASHLRANTFRILVTLTFITTIVSSYLYLTHIVQAVLSTKIESENSALCAKNLLSSTMNSSEILQLKLQLAREKIVNGAQAINTPDEVERQLYRVVHEHQHLSRPVTCERRKYEDSNLSDVLLKDKFESIELGVDLIGIVKAGHQFGAHEINSADGYPIAFYWPVFNTDRQIQDASTFMHGRERRMCDPEAAFSDRVFGTGDHCSAVRLEGNWIAETIKHIYDGNDDYFYIEQSGRDLPDEVIFENLFVGEPKTQSLLPCTHRNNLSGRYSCSSHKDIHIDGEDRIWRITALTNIDDIPKQSESIRIALLWLLLLTLATFYRLSLASNLHPYSYSLLLSVAPLIGILIIWAIHFNSNPISNHEKELLTDARKLDEKIQSIYIADVSKETPRRFIPTGLLVNSFDFVSSTNVLVTGEVWQRRVESEFQNAHYEGSLVKFIDDVDRAQSGTIDSRHLNESGEIISLQEFSVTLRQNFDYKLYPFDRQQVWIRMSPAKHSDSEVLVPDIHKYLTLNPGAQPGVVAAIVSDEWKLLRTNFLMKERELLSSHRNDDRKTLELHFNIELKRSFWDPFIAHLFPLIVVLVMLFILLLTITKDQNLRDVFGFNTSTVVATSSALFFVVLISHVQLRDSIESTVLTYLDWFYLLTYAVILFITFNAVAFSMGIHNKYLNNDDEDRFPQRSYWPVLANVLLVITYIYFVNPNTELDDTSANFVRPVVGENSRRL